MVSVRVDEMAFLRVLIMPILLSFSQGVHGNDSRDKRLLVNDPNYVHTVELKLQEMSEKLTKVVTTNAYLTQELSQVVSANVNLTRRVAELEHYQDTRRSCETGKKIIQTPAPNTLQLPQTHRITFSNHFQNNPVVTLALSGVDIDHGYNIRVDVTASDIDPYGFNLVFSDWGDSKTYLMAASWIACPDE